MSFILSWSGYFSRKGWDPRLWSKSKNANSYEKCAKLIGKMCVTPPTEEEYREHFWDESFDAKEVEASPPEVSSKELKPEQPKEEKVDPPRRRARATKAPTPAKKSTTKTRTTRSRSKTTRTSKTKDAT